MLKELSFKTKLQSTLGALGLIALATVGYLAFCLSHDLTESKMDLLGRSSESIADKVDRNLFERYGDVQAFALSEPARSGDAARIGQFMTDMMAAYAPIYDVMLVLDKTGSVIAVNSVDKNNKPLDSKKMLGKNYADQDWFKIAVEGKIAAGSAHFTDLRNDPDTGAYASTDGNVMIFTAPIRDAKTNEVVGVWSNRMSWKDVVVDIVSKESQKLKDEKLSTISAFLVGEDGTYLVHRDPKMILKAKADSFLNYAKGKKGDTLLHVTDDTDEIRASAIEVFTISKGYVSYPGQKWTYILRGPSSDPEMKRNVYMALAGLILIFCIAGLAFMVTRRTASQLELVIDRLHQGSTKVSQTASDVTTASHSLSEASTEQASALQETAASIEEINAMIKKSSENSTRSQDVAGQSSDIAKRGKESVDKMSQAINEINISNEAILSQISASNGQISEIAKVIAEIGNKTKVINDIVFQTKLLSFNASVEAARAGEHGKGFAVVAEEVGNLAQMSGNAAKEISEMLAESIKKVESIVDETKEKVERLISEGRQKVQSGIVIADQCGEVLTEVVANVDELKSMVTEIMVASQEQSQGVNEITKAMNELDQTTHANASTSQHVSGYASSLSNESNQMNGVVVDLVAVVRGGVASLKSGNPGTSPVTDAARTVAYSPNDNVHALKLIPRASTPSINKVHVVSGDATPASHDPRFKEV